MMSRQKTSIFGQSLTRAVHGLPLVIVDTHHNIITDYCIPLKRWGNKKKKVLRDCVKDKAPGRTGLVANLVAFFLSSAVSYLTVVGGPSIVGWLHFFRHHSTSIKSKNNTNYSIRHDNIYPEEYFCPLTM